MILDKKTLLKNWLNSRFHLTCFKELGNLNFIKLLRVFFTPSVTEGVKKNRSNLMKFRLGTEPLSKN